MSFTYRYARPALTVDAVVFGLDDEDLKVLLVERAGAPFAGTWALPGGFVNVGEDLEVAARRELAEETGLRLADAYLEQLFTFGAPGRDPREHVVSCAWYALVNIRDHTVRAATDAADARWWRVQALPELAFDHDRIVDVARQRLRGKVRYRPIGFALLPERFTLSQLQHLYETLLERPVDKRNFRKKMLALGFVLDTGERETDVPRRPARLYRFDEARYRELERDGFEMWV
ncbi:MAG: NUDIX domain-containing protein [Myxococcota bacterium]